MKRIYKSLCATLLATTVSTGHTDTITDGNYYQQETTNNTKQLVTYLLNLGAYLGYNIENTPGDKNTIKSKPTLLDINTTQLAQTYTFYTLMGALPVNAISQSLSQFVPKGQQGVENLNAFANYVFAQQEYNSPGANNGKVSVNPLIDQKQYQNDPVSQGVLNILTTPNPSYCTDNSGKQWTSNCEYLVQGQVSYNAIGTIPSTQKFFSYETNSSIVPQLNSNSLLGPLMYDTEQSSDQGESSGSSGSSSANDSSKGLTADNQAQEADVFIRYLSGAVAPLSLPSRQNYDALYLTATSKQSTELERNTAIATIATYLAEVRSYSAKVSVALSNFYYILGKRMPQSQNTEGSQKSSQALTEFTMATRRLFNPDMTANQQWINQINDASSATVQKEMAVLLAEINYQLYLNRQQQERLLLTNSALLIQSTTTFKPALIQP